MRYVFGDKGVDARWKGIAADLPDKSALREKWADIYAVCGGNIFELKECIRMAKRRNLAEGEGLCIAPHCFFPCRSSFPLTGSCPLGDLGLPHSSAALHFAPRS